MNGLSTLSAILKGYWLIDPSYAEAKRELVEAWVYGGKTAFKAFEKDDDEPRDKIQPVALATSAQIPVYTKSQNWQSFSDAPEGSIARIVIDDPLMKHDFCGSAGSMSLAKWVTEAANNPNIIGTILDIDSPGGMVGGIQTLSAAIAAHEKPIYTHVNDGMAASAAYWIASETDKVYVSYPTDSVGSIGVYISLADKTKRDKKMGIVRTDFYANQSTEKNLPYRKALNGDPSLLIRELDAIAELFINTVQYNRKIKTSGGDPFKGAMYAAEEALSIGLIDGILSRDEVITQLYQAAKNQSKSQFYV